MHSPAPSESNPPHFSHLPPLILDNPHKQQHSANMYDVSTGLNVLFGVMMEVNRTERIGDKIDNMSQL